MNLNWADPSFFGSRWDAGVSGFGFFFPRTLDLYRDGVEQKQEAVKNVAGRFNFFLGRPLNAYAKLDFNLTLGYEQFSEGDDTAEDFVLPRHLHDVFRHRVQLLPKRLASGLEGRAFQRSDWEFWGLPGNTEYDPDHESYLKWNASLTKTFWLDDFMKLGVQ
jgi:outer membrane protein assembly factor BamA